MFELKTNIVLVSVDFEKSQKNVLSLSDSSIVFPSMDLQSLSNIDNTIKEYVCNLFNDPIIIKPYVNTLKFIELHNQYCGSKSSNTQCINMIHGTTVPRAALAPNAFWFPFDFTDTIIPNELAIIGKVISHSI